MKTLVNTTDFSDCAVNDWDHYFSGTALVWTLPSITAKRRLFLAGSPTNAENGKTVIPGQYLTKLKEWKNKQIPFEGWYKRLAPVSIRDMFFRCGAGVTLYSPNLQRNLKKAPRWNYAGMVHFGQIDNADMSAQGLTYWAFRDLYDANVEAERSLAQILTEPNELQAENDSRGFIVDRSGTPWRIFYRGKRIAKYVTATNRLIFEGQCKSWSGFMNTVERLQDYGVKIGGTA